MGMAQPTPVTTIEELLTLPDDGMRHELLDGVHVVTPAPRLDHQRVLGSLLATIHSQLATYAVLEVLTSPADIYLGPRTLVQPDLFIVQRMPPGTSWKDVPVPRVAIEILSPSTASRDRITKRRIYLESGIQEYWIVDIDARVIERWKAGDERPEIIDSKLEWSIESTSGVIDVPSLFE